MNEFAMTILAAAIIYGARAKSDDMADEKAKHLAQALEEAQLLIAEATAKVQR